MKEIDKFSHFTDPEVTRLTDLMDDTFGAFTNDTQRNVKTAFPSRISGEREQDTFDQQDNPPLRSRDRLQTSHPLIHATRKDGPSSLPHGARVPRF